MSNWYAVRTVSAKERKVALLLSERGFSIFLPMETDYRGQPRQRHMEPLMPGYVFVLCDWEDFAEIHGVEGASGFVRYMRDDGVAWPAPFPLKAILGLQIEERAGLFDKTRSQKPKRYHPKKGEQVQIIAGPYYQFVAKVLSVNGTTAKLMIEGFDKPRRKSIDIAHMQAA